MKGFWLRIVEETDDHFMSFYTYLVNSVSEPNIRHTPNAELSGVPSEILDILAVE
jgi:hypothetical protein